MSRPRPGLRPRASRAAIPRSGTLFLSELYVKDAISCEARGFVAWLFLPATSGSVTRAPGRAIAPRLCEVPHGKFSADSCCFRRSAFGHGSIVPETIGFSRNVYFLQHLGAAVHPHA